MILYHGSNVSVQKPRLFITDRRADFGSGFYLTSSFEQASPVANDNTMPTLRLYFAGVYSEEEAIKRLLPQKLRDQYAFKTKRALDELTYCEVVSE